MLVVDLLMLVVVLTLRESLVSVTMKRYGQITESRGLHVTDESFLNRLGKSIKETIDCVIIQNSHLPRSFRNVLLSQGGVEVGEGGWGLGRGVGGLGERG